MNYDKLIYRKTTQPEIVLTVDFGGIGELTVVSESAGEVTWRRLTTPVKDVLQAKLAACGFDSWQSEEALPACWGLELFHNGQLAKRICGCNTVPEMIRSLLEFCTALAENRSKRRIANQQSENKRKHTMKIFAAIDLETTGLNPASNEVLEIAIVPLNPDFTISTDIPEFSCRVRAEHPECIEQQAMGVNGLDPNEGDSLAEVRYALMNWAAENGIEQITPLAHNLAFDMSFMKVAFPEFSRILTHHGRDSMRLAYILNDVLRVRGDEEMFSSGSLKSVKTVLDIEGEVQHHALEDARDAAHAYRKMIAMLDMA